jgi:hypothetical protein
MSHPKTKPQVLVFATATLRHVVGGSLAISDVGSTPYPSKYIVITIGIFGRLKVYCDLLKEKDLGIYNVLTDETPDLK